MKKKNNVHTISLNYLLRDLFICFQFDQATQLTTKNVLDSAEITIRTMSRWALGSAMNRLDKLHILGDSLSMVQESLYISGDMLHKVLE